MQGRGFLEMQFQLNQLETLHTVLSFLTNELRKVMLVTWFTRI